MIIAKLFFIIFYILNSCFFCNAEEELSLTTDNRIRTHIYNPNEVYLLILNHGFQSTIEFDNQEQVETISLGDSYAWNITPLGNRIFIKPLEAHVHTNMTIITNKRIYYFDIISKGYEEEGSQDITYVMRFFYPQNILKQNDEYSRR